MQTFKMHQDIVNVTGAAAIPRIINFSYSEEMSDWKCGHQHQWTKDVGIDWVEKWKELGTGLQERPAQMAAKVKDAELETIFNGLAKKWKDETRWSSVTMRRYAHSSYQAILVLGGKEPQEVTKLILKQMQKSPDLWFEALRRLNNPNDPAKNAKSFEDATEAWLAWGRMSGLIS